MAYYSLTIGVELNKKQSIIACVILFILATGFAEAQDKSVTKEQGKSISELGVVYKGMPKEYLENAGFTEYLLLDHKKEGNKERMTYSDWTTQESGDTITFVIEDGKVKDWVREGKKEAKKQDI